ncbi:unnamed protein product [Gongylonema pulchrum]|uniref:Uncharacterized protein n=1 Tax=Gongylonema pulchrum TaxID=637853 RepID=A0A183DMR6_9BILA|nr:unnamed protein product [Gongylonema pulchrum]
MVREESEQTLPSPHGFPSGYVKCERSDKRKAVMDYHGHSVVNVSILQDATTSHLAAPLIHRDRSSSLTDKYHK